MTTSPRAHGNLDFVAQLVERLLAESSSS